MSTKPETSQASPKQSAEASPVPSEGRTYDLALPRKSFHADKINVGDGGVLAIGEFRGQKIITREAIDGKTGKKVQRHRLVINIESLDSAATPIAIECNGWEEVPAELPFTKGDRIVARVVGEFNGSYSADAVAKLSL